MQHVHVHEHSTKDSTHSAGGALDLDTGTASARIPRFAVDTWSQRTVLSNGMRSALSRQVTEHVYWIGIHAILSFLPESPCVVVGTLQILSRAEAITAAFNHQNAVNCERPRGACLHLLCANSSARALMLMVSVHDSGVGMRSWVSAGASTT